MERYSYDRKAAELDMVKLRQSMIATRILISGWLIAAQKKAGETRGTPEGQHWDKAKKELGDCLDSLSQALLELGRLPT